MSTARCCYDDVANSNEAREARENPTWVADAEASICMSCKTFEFWYVASAEWRRHHCRSCGWVVCKECLSPDELEMDRWVSSTAGHPIHYGAPTKPKTICRGCAIAAPTERDRRLRQNPEQARGQTAASAQFSSGGLAVSRPVSPSPEQACSQTAASAQVSSGGLAVSRPVSPSPEQARGQTAASAQFSSGGLAVSRPVSPSPEQACSQTAASAQVSSGGLAVSRPVSPSPEQARGQTAASAQVSSGGLAVSRPVSPSPEQARSNTPRKETRQKGKKCRKKKMSPSERELQLQQEKEEMRKIMQQAGLDMPSTPPTLVSAATTDGSPLSLRGETQPQRPGSVQPQLDTMQRRIAAIQSGTLDLQAKLSCPFSPVDLRISPIVQMRPQQSQRSEADLWKEAAIEVGTDFKTVLAGHANRAKEFGRKAKRGEWSEAVAGVHQDLKGGMSECGKTLTTMRG